MTDRLWVFNDVDDVDDQTEDRWSLSTYDLFVRYWMFIHFYNINLHTSMKVKTTLDRKSQRFTKLPTCTIYVPNEYTLICKQYKQINPVKSLCGLLVAATLVHWNSKNVCGK